MKKRHALPFPYGKLLRLLGLLAAVMISVWVLTFALSPGTAPLDAVFSSLLGNFPQRELSLSERIVLSQSPRLASTPIPETEESERSEPLHGTLYYEAPELSAKRSLRSIVQRSLKSEASPLGDENNIEIINETGTDVDVKALLETKPKVTVSDTEPCILIIHTHASEAYTQEGGDTYEESDVYRTQEADKSVLILGDIVTETLEENGIRALHDNGVYDYPSYAGSYNRTAEKIESYLEKYPTISAVIDIHRDASEDSSGSLSYKTTCDVNGETASQVMLVVGTDTSGLEHDSWRDNLAFALRLQNTMLQKYPSLPRPLKLSKYRYNGHLTPGSLIAEIGYCGNTLKEAKLAAECFAYSLAETMESLKD